MVIWILFSILFFIYFFLEVFRDGVVFEKSLQIQKEAVPLWHLSNHPE
jgi:hypothetical protein